MTKTNFKKSKLWETKNAEYLINRWQNKIDRDKISVETQEELIECVSREQKAWTLYKKYIAEAIEKITELPEEDQDRATTILYRKYKKADGKIKSIANDLNELQRGANARC